MRPTLRFQRIKHLSVLSFAVALQLLVGCSSTSSALPAMTSEQQARFERFIAEMSDGSDRALDVTAACVSIYYDDWSQNWWAGSGRDLVLADIQDCIEKTDSDLFCRDASDGSGPVCGFRDERSGYSLIVHL